MNFFFKVSKKDFSSFCNRVRSDYLHPCPTFCINTKRSDGSIVTSFLLDDLEIAQSVKPVGRRIEYYINPFWKEA